jgi:DNA-binding transcriptional LysR family regulator
MLPQAQAVATEAETLERLLAQRTRQFSGVIRVTTPEIIANMMLTPWLAEFMEIYPDIKVEVIATDERLSLSRGEADVAIRAGRMPKEAGIVVRKLADGPWGLYCSKSYTRRKRGLAKTVEELNDHLVIGANGSFAKLEPFVWLRARPRANGAHPMQHSRQRGVRDEGGARNQRAADSSRRCGARSRAFVCR